MHKAEIQELKLMEEVSKCEGIATQRDLAHSLDISLGLVNVFIKRIVRKGYFKVSTIPGRRVRYLFTPKGLAEKSRLTTDYIRHSLSFYREIREGFQQIADDLNSQNIREVALVGTGELAELFFFSMREADIKITQVFSTNNGGLRFMGYNVKPLDGIDSDYCDVVCLVELDNHLESLKLLKEFGVPPEKIIMGLEI